MDVTPAKKRDGIWSILWQQTPQRDAFPKPDAEPTDGCDECTRLSKLRRAARKEHDGSTATDCNIRIRLHADGHGRRES